MTGQYIPNKRSDVFLLKFALRTDSNDETQDFVDAKTKVLTRRLITSAFALRARAKRSDKAFAFLPIPTVTLFPHLPPNLNFPCQTSA